MWERHFKAFRGMKMARYKDDLNTIFYTYIKRLYSTEYRLTSDYKKQPNCLLELIEILKKELDGNASVHECRNSALSYLEQVLAGKKKELKLDEYTRLFMQWDDLIYARMFVTALQLVYFKNEIDMTIKEELEDYEVEGHPLSLKYDNVSTYNAYLQRVKTGLVTEEIISRKQTKNAFFRENLLFLENSGISLFPVFFSIMAESANQSITSKSGSGYEDRIYQHLLQIGIPEDKIQRLNHEEVGSIEHDFKFELDGKKYGISAKRSFRERYKQYVNLLQKYLKDDDLENEIETGEIFQEINQPELESLTKKELDCDVLITITIGTDLTENKAKIIRQFGVYIFVAPEIYNAHGYLQELDGVFSIYDLTLETLRTL